MSKTPLLGAVVFPLIVLAAAVPAGAASVYGLPAPMTGERSVGAGLVTNDCDWMDAIFRWEITDNLDSTYTYTYTLSNFDRPGVSHLIVDVSDSALDDPGAVANFEFNGRPSRKVELGDFRGIIGAVKFDIGGDGRGGHHGHGDCDDGDAITYSFTSNRMPVLADVFVKGGRRTFLVNTGICDHGSSEAGDFIAAPDSRCAPAFVPPPALIVAPVPPAAWLGLVGMGFVALTKLRKSFS